MSWNLHVAQQIVIKSDIVYKSNKTLEFENWFFIES